MLCDRSELSGPISYLGIEACSDSPSHWSYPDSGKFGLFAGSVPFGSPNQRTLTRCLVEDAEMAYWNGED